MDMNTSSTGSSSVDGNMTGILVLICVIIVMHGCSDKNDIGPVAPDGNGYDTEVMALIPAGSFRMGNITDNSFGMDNEKPVREVVITRRFLMSRKEVTQQQYETIMGQKRTNFNGPDLPVENVTWYDAVRYCNALSKLEGFDTCYSGQGALLRCDFNANGYRLPTEAEWEYAARAGTQTDYYTGNMLYSGTSPLDSALERAGWYSGNSSSTTHPVGLKQANIFGLYDMHGNVSEWCWDWYDSAYYGISPVEDPTGPVSGSVRVLRGGSWISQARRCRSAYREYFNPEAVITSHGFRVARTY
jgi:formylglycine-generating enzyme